MVNVNLVKKIVFIRLLKKNAFVVQDFSVLEVLVGSAILEQHIMEQTVFVI